MTSTLQAKSLQFLDKRNELSTAAQFDQRYFLNARDNTVEGGLRMMIEGLENYVNAYNVISGDYYAAPCAEEIARSLISLLSGPGRFDGGTLDSAIREILSKVGLNADS